MRRPRRDDDHFAAVQAVRHLVQVRQSPWPGRSASPLRLKKFSIVPMALLTSSLVVSTLALHARFVDAQNVALHLVQQRVHLALVIINPPDDVRAGLDHFPQQEFFADDVEVIAKGSPRSAPRPEVATDTRCRRPVPKAACPSAAAATVMTSIGIRASIHLDQRLVNRLVPQVVKRLLADRP